MATEASTARHAADQGGVALPVADCLAAVTMAFGLSYAEVVGNSRALRAARSRHCFCWLASIATTAEPKEIGRRIKRSRRAVSRAIAFVNARAGSSVLRQHILHCLDSGIPTAGELLSFGRQLEALTRPDTMEG